MSAPDLDPAVVAAELDREPSDVTSVADWASVAGSRRAAGLLLLDEVARLRAERDEARATAADTSCGQRVARLHESYGGQIAAAFKAEAEALARAEAAEAQVAAVRALPQRILNTVDPLGLGADVRMACVGIVRAALAAPTGEGDET